MTPRQEEKKRRIKRSFDEAVNDIAIGADSAERIDALKAAVKELIGPPTYDLLNYRLCLPVDAQGGKTGVAVYVDPLALPEFAAPFFKVTPDSIIFTCPDDGAPTESAKYCRSELQGKDQAKVTTADYFNHHVIFCQRKIANPMGLGDKIVNAQLHTGGFPMVKIAASLMSDGFLIRAAVKHKAEKGALDVYYPLLSKVPYDAPIDLTIGWSPASGGLGQKLYISAVGGIPHLLDMDYPTTIDGKPLMINPTLGVYNQSNKGLRREACTEFFKWR